MRWGCNWRGSYHAGGFPPPLRLPYDGAVPSPATEVFLASLKRCLGAPGFLTGFYERFTGSSEEVREKFRGADMQRQVRMLEDSLYVVAVGEDEVSLHLAGTCGGCPGIDFTSRGIIEPVIRAAAPRAKLFVSNGWQIPKGAKRVVPR